MKPFTIKSIKEFANVVTGGTPSTRQPEYWNGTIPWLNSGALNDGDIKSPSKYITELGLNKSSAKLMPKDTVLIALTGSTTGQVGYLTFEACANQSVTGILPSCEHAPRYLYYFLKTQRQKIKSDAFGGGQPHINQQYVKDIKIPFPENYNDQTRIASLLTKVERLIDQRNEHLKQFDKLLESVFIEMFGDPVKNEMDWNKEYLSDLVVDIESGSSPKCEAREATSEEWGILKLGAVTSCSYIETENKALPKGISPRKDREVKSGDLLFSRKNTQDLVAACAFVFKTRQRLLLPDLIFRFVFKDTNAVNPIYVWKLLTCHSQRKKIQSLASGAAGSMPNISKTNLKKIKLPIPPPDLQKHFASIVEKVESIKSQYQASLSNLEKLYESLSHKAFKGELNLSRIPLPQKHNKLNKLSVDAQDIYEKIIPPSIGKILETLDTFNELSGAIYTPTTISELSSLGRTENIVVGNAIKQMSELYSPLQELKQMGSIAKAMNDAHEALTSPLSIEIGRAINQSAKLAESIAASIPQVDFSWLEGNEIVLLQTSDAFSNMQKAMRQIIRPSIKLEPPDDMSLFCSDSTARKKQIEKWLDSYLGKLDSGFFSSETFMLEIQELIQENMEEEIIEIGIEEYDYLKELIFGAIKNNRLKQHYSDNQNCILVSKL